jgi:hypothetical protein
MARYHTAAGRPLWFYIVIATVVGIAAFIIGILIGRFGACPDNDVDTTVSDAFTKALRDADPEIADLLINTIDNNNIKENLR